LRTIRICIRILVLNRKETFMHTTLKKLALSARRIALGSLMASAIVAPTMAQGEVNVYTTREPQLILPLLEVFTQDTGIKVNTVFVKDGLIERVKAEGTRSPADVLMTVDIGNLVDLVEQGVTQAIESPVLNAAIAPNLRGADGHWYALSLRDRVAYADKDLDLQEITYEQMADPKWKGRFCIRSGQHPYNTALIAAMIAHNGEQATEQWLRGVKANLARKATGGDRNVARDILGGICDLGLANAYYVGIMRSADPGTDNRQWGDAIKVIRPTFESTGGTFVNISGAAVAQFAPNRDNAIKLLEYLVSDDAQRIYADANYELPVKAGIEVNPIVQSFGPMVIDPLPLIEVARYRQLASELVDKVGFND
jgi:iron(III) transport system substrate-binding protein